MQSTNENEKVRQWKRLLSRAIKGGYQPESIISGEEGRPIAANIFESDPELLLEHPTLVIGLIFEPNFARALWGTHHYPDPHEQFHNWESNWQVQLKKLVNELAQPNLACHLLDHIYQDLIRQAEAGWVLEDFLAQLARQTSLSSQELTQLTDELLASNWVNFDLESELAYLQPELLKIIKRYGFSGGGLTQTTLEAAGFEWLPCLTTQLCYQIGPVLSNWPAAGRDT